MGEIKLMDESFDFWHEVHYAFHWDLEINGEKYDVIDFPKYVHTISSKHGNCSLYAIKHNEDHLDYKNYQAFMGHAPRWGIECKEENEISYKHYDNGYIDGYISTTITRNDKPFYSFSCNDMGFALAQAQVYLMKLQEHPVSFHFENWEKMLIYRKIMFNKFPAYISTILSNLRVIIKPDIDAFKLKHPNMIDDDIEQRMYESFGALEDGCVVDDILQSSAIGWFRE